MGTAKTTAPRVQGEWFDRWFGEDYKALYAHRDPEQADAQAGAVIAAVAADSGWNILDIGCGAGRHLASFSRRGLAAVGVDLSPVLLRDARREKLRVVRADMRRLPFPARSFDLAASFFTSFGYFDSVDEDVETLREFRRVVKPAGFLFLDLPNPPHVSRHLMPRETLERAGRRVEILRTLEEDRVIKRIRILSGGREENHEERVRLYSPSVLGPILDILRLETVRIFGDERGAEFDPERSPRMSLLLRVAA